ncbi:MAG: tRNA (N6-threonylcarbamoyladenosine(37)-N6)-methyltransferase TrmO [Dehalococcoidia bacterium]|nr:tRNA (N6-threonylcarbamoyladenosine(37)-N6)-methyltransferase TrmO [Dehalococcoidia bacterium]
MDSVTYEPIGIIRTTFKEKTSTPIQGIFDPDSKGEVEVFPQYADGLKKITGFSHLILIYHFHLAEDCSLMARPFLDNKDKGIFSIRHFNRPNPLGISVVRLHNVKVNVLMISEVDIVDGTPLLDIKSYISDFDNRHNTRNGWYEHASNESKYKRGKGIQTHL